MNAGQGAHSEDSTRESGFGIVHRSLRGRLTPTELAVYVALTWRADGKGFCWPSYATIAEDAGVSRRTAVNAIQLLVSKGLVETYQRRDSHGNVTSNGYLLHFFAPEKVVQPVHQGGAAGAQ